jgi:hypothetical protein
VLKNQQVDIRPGILGLKAQQSDRRIQDEPVPRILAVRWPPNCGVSELKILKI